MERTLTGKCAICEAIEVTYTDIPADVALEDIALVCADCADHLPAEL